MEERLDKILIQRGLVSSRVRAEQMIREVGVMVNGKLINKTGKKFPVDAIIEVIEEEIPYVSRGALKLKHSIEHWQLTIAGSCLDIGASTGGFTEVLLEFGADKVYCVDVGRDQLHQKLKANPNIINLERTHVRELNGRLIPEEINVCVIDVSFISLIKIFPFIHAFLASGAIVVALVKPQFEVGKENIGKGGIVKNHQLYSSVLEEIKACGSLNNLHSVDFIESPILGGDGNREFLMLFKYTTEVV